MINGHEPLVTPDRAPRPTGKPRPKPFTAETAPPDVHSLAYLNRLPLGSLLGRGREAYRLDEGPTLVHLVAQGSMWEAEPTFADATRHEGAVACASLLPLDVRHVPE